VKAYFYIAVAPLFHDVMKRALLAASRINGIISFNSLKEKRVLPIRNEIFNSYCWRSYDTVQLEWFDGRGR